MKTGCLGSPHRLALPVAGSLQDQDQGQAPWPGA